MATDKQQAANEKNAKLSHGPTSPEGLDAIKLNAFRHGMATRHNECFVLLLDEDPEKFDALREKLRDEHNPETETEFLLVRHMAESEWLRSRAIRFQSEIVALGPNNKSIDKLPLFLRYQATHERAFHKSLKELQNIRKQKQNTEIGIESQKREVAAEIRAEKTQVLRAETLVFRKEELAFKKEVFQAKKMAQPAPPASSEAFQQAA